MTNWKHTFRAGHFNYVEQTEVEARLTRLEEAGERLSRALQSARQGIKIGEEYNEVIQGDWKALTAKPETYQGDGSGKVGS